MSTWHVCLTLAGAGAELIGLVLVIYDLRATSRDAVQVKPTVTRMYAQSASASATAGRLTVTGGRQPTLEERVAALERDSANFREDVGQRVAKLSRRISEETSRASGEARSHADDLDRELRLWLSAQLGGTLGRKAVGVLLFMLGVCLSAAANLVA